MNKRVSGLICALLVASVFIYGDVNAAPPNAGKKVVAGLPEAAQPTNIDPCAEKKLEDIYAEQGPHDGILFWFDGDSANYDAGLDIWFNDISGSTYVCELNPNLDSNATKDNVNLWSELGWARSGANWWEVARRLVDGNNWMDAASAHPDHSKSCYICGLIRFRDGCFPPGVRIATDEHGSTKLVEDIAVGDSLWNPVTRQQSRVVKVIQGPEQLPLIRLSYDEVSLAVSQEHPILTDTGVKMARELTLQDQVYDGQGELHQLTTLEVLPVNEGQTVINFILDAGPEQGDDARMVLADGIVTGDLILQRALAKSNGG